MIQILKPIPKIFHLITLLKDKTEVSNLRENSPASVHRAMESLANAFSVLILDAEDNDQARATVSDASNPVEGTTTSGYFAHDLPLLSRFRIIIWRLVIGLGLEIL